jgi:hypothetical protein
LQHDTDDHHGGHGEPRKKPTLRVGIVLPKQIFQRRKYQAIISKSISDILQEKCLHDEDKEEEDLIAANSKNYYDLSRFVYFIF